ncbi:MAG: formimidoylglutamate deiminase [Alphaproteobacteria bacterium]|nr:formimidoylglutamate deiminase [Alphaproteobacteria bacterium]
MTVSASHLLSTPALWRDGAMAGPATVAIDATGTISAITPGLHPDATPAGGLVVPGMANLHSHAFQRAMAGLAERAGPEGDSFWSWREVMYRFLARLRPEDVQAITAQLGVELLRNGYTTLGEFHYLHCDPSGHCYADPAELAHRVVAGVQQAGIALTLLPVLYQTAQFGGVPPTEGQRRFILSTDTFARVVEELITTYHQDPNIALGLAPHSLRAVPPAALAEVVALAHQLGNLPLHIHAAEQPKEVADCIAWSGERPVEWLLNHIGLSERWCLIHATHMTAAETQRLATSGAVAGLCPTTEANLGDGLFPLLPYLAAGGRFGIGSDSNVGTSPVEELRWLEYTRRLEQQGRNLVETTPGASTGAALFRQALAGGAQALGRPIGALEPGLRADLVVLDPDHPALTHRPGNLAIDSWVFSGSATPVRHVMVGGRWVIRDGRHADEETIAAGFRRALDHVTG